MDPAIVDPLKRKPRSRADHPKPILVVNEEIALSCNTFPSVIDERAAGTYPLAGWVESIPFDNILRDGFERLHRQEGMKILVDIGNARSAA